MATTRILFLLFCLTCLGLRDAHASDFRIDSTRACVVRSATSLLYVKEKTNRNDNEKISEMFTQIGYPYLVKAKWTSRMWCMAFVSYCFKTCNVPNPIQGPAAVISWKGAKKLHISSTAKVQPADVAIYTWGSHGGLVIEAHANPKFPFVQTIEGNTSAPKESGSTKQGVWRKTRIRREIRYFVRIIT